MIALLVGTRPELIKMAPLLKKIVCQKIPYIFIHSNQHYSEELDNVIIKDLQLPKPDFYLNVGSGTHAFQTGRIMERLEKILIDLKPSVIVVHGDTNTTLAGALTAKKLQINVAHVEAGLRSFDYKMPEEINRILVDRIADVLFAPTEIARANLLKEGIENKKIYVTGNTIVDAIQQHLKLITKSKIIDKLNLAENQYILVTAHRQENVDIKERLSKLISLISYAGKITNAKIIYPIHPRTKKRLIDFKIKIPANVSAISPLGYIDMLNLMYHASMILTDSGGIQEEAYILQKPLITLRDSTERPETLTANFIIDLDKKKLTQAINAYKTKSVHWQNQFGDGTTSDKIMKVLLKFIKNK